MDRCEYKAWFIHNGRTSCHSMTAATDEDALVEWGTFMGRMPGRRGDAWLIARLGRVVARRSWRPNASMEGRGDNGDAAAGWG